ncbi:MHF histone-fold complex subunit 1 [Cyberlindnera fabianii]|uniref:MHF histone-fold complex subunit 1 n=1 Tax=Cyberlindnera fabianii TaxID=36022 RepID=A0A1V2L9U9_CYBFA|nr:MHF histone-fold complex subunit 1 [Cyberlindnera fabianii]
MKALTEDEKALAAHLKARLWLAVGKIVEAEVAELSAPEGKPIKATPQFIASLVELVYNQVIQLGEDLESFARHAKRKTITPDDMMMVVRRSEDLTQLLREHLQVLNGRALEMEDDDGLEDNLLQAT